MVGFQQGYIDDLDSDIELALDINLQSYGMVARSEENGTITTTKLNFSIGSEKSIDQLYFNLEDQKEIKPHRVDAKIEISVADLHRQLYKD